LTFGTDLPNEEQMYKIDSLITTPLIAVYISLMSIVFLNLFIALLGSSLSKVYDKAEAYLTFKRAKEILKVERSLENKVSLYFCSIKFCFLRAIRFCCMHSQTYSNYFRSKDYNPYENRKNCDSSSDKISEIEKQMLEVAYLVVNIFF
jgi:hypothetical protein